MSRKLHLFWILAFLVVHPCAGGVTAQEAAKKGLEALSGAYKQINQWKAEELARAAKDLRAHEAELNRLLLMSDAVVLKGENEYRKATEKLELAIKLHEAAPAKQRSAIAELAYGETLLELGRLYALMCDYERARALALRGWQTQQRNLGSVHTGQPGLIRAALTVATILNEIDQPHEAAEYVSKAKTIIARMPRQFSDPIENPLMTTTLVAEAEISERTGNHHAAQTVALEALGVLEKTRPRIYPDRAAVLHTLAKSLLEQGEGPGAMPYLQEALQILDQCHPQGHPSRAALFGTFAKVQYVRDKKPDALVSIGKAVGEYKRLFPKDKDKYPRGHPGLIQVETSLGDWLDQIGQKTKALELHRDAWENCQSFFVSPHEIQVSAMLSYGRSLRASGKVREALAQFDEAERLAAELDARKHRGLRAFCLIERGKLQMQSKEFAPARKTFGEALAICRQSVPQGHPQLSTILQALGAMHLLAGDAVKSRHAFGEALRTDQFDLVRFASKAAEAEALAYARPRQLAFHGYLVAGRNQSDVAEGYALVWNAKARVTRLLQERRAGTRLALANPNVRKQWEELVDTRTKLSWLTTSSTEERATRDSLVSRMTDRKEQLERELAVNAPDFLAAADFDVAGPASLAKKLPRRSAFVDLVRYEDSLNHDPPMPYYAAFVVTSGGAPIRIDLGKAGPIDGAVNAWRRDVVGWKRARAFSPEVQQTWIARSEEDAAVLRRLVWEPVSAAFPEGTRLVYVAPDGDLARFPFVALPGAKPQTILLEDFLIAQVPHGPFLLQQLSQPELQGDGVGPFLAVGAVAYGQPEAGVTHRFPQLPGTAQEVSAAGEKVKKDRLQILTQDRATNNAVRSALPSACEALFATHGYFREKELAAEHQRIIDQLRTWLSDPPAEPAAGAGRRNPLSYVGLALAGANQPSRSGAEGILSGETIAELPLDKLRLVVLSACDTGLGEHTAGEGVQGLVRAFHLAGCPNVVASLWQVDDEATRMLMSEFYRQMHEGKKSPLEALRLAQLSIYRSAPDGSPVHPHLWAAFVYSGGQVPLPTWDESESWTPHRERSTAAPLEENSPGLPTWTYWIAAALLAFAVTVFVVNQRRLGRSAGVGGA